MTSLISAAPVSTGQFQSLDGLRAHSLPSDAMIYASATQVNPANQNPGSYAFQDSGINSITSNVTGSIPATTLSPFADLYKEGSLYFTPGSNYMNLVYSNSTINWYTAGMTVEAWVNYPTFTGASVSIGSTPVAIQLPYLMGVMQIASSGLNWCFGSNVNGYVTFGYNSSGTQSVMAQTPLSANTWNHIAVSVAPSGFIYIFINGVQSQVVANRNGTLQSAAYYETVQGTPSTSSYPLSLGTFNSLSPTLNAYVADIRITTGAGLYTGSTSSYATFTVPSAPLSPSATGATQFLLRAGQNSPTIQSGALTFDRGLKQFYNFGATTFNIATRGFTCVFRYTWNGTATNYERIFQACLSKADQNNSLLITRYGTASQLTFQYVLAGSYATAVNSATGLAQGTTYVAALVYNPNVGSGTAQWWINGSPSGSAVTGLASAITTDLLTPFTFMGVDYLGGPSTAVAQCGNFSSNTFAVYNRPLSNTEILTAYTALIKVPATPLQKTLEIGDINGTPALSVAGDGKVFMDSVGLTSNVLPWPPAAMTGYDTVINGGVYKARASNELNSGTPAWYAFARGASPWATPSNYSVNSPYPYTGTVTTTDISGTVYPGEWLQVQLASQVFLSSYYTQINSSTQAPQKFVILGSRDGVNWTLVDSRSGVSAASQTFTLSSIPAQAFTYYRIVCNQLTGNNQVFALQQFILYGTADTSPALTIAPATTFSSSVATPALTGVSGSNYVPQDFSSSGLNIPAYVVSNTATVANTVAYSSFGPFAGEGSFQFNGGTGSGISFPSSVQSLNYNIFTSDFTLEFWFYNTIAVNGTQVLVSRGSVFTSSDWCIYIQSNGLVYFTYNSIASYLTTASAPTANAWNHLAVCLKGSTLYLLLNGNPSLNGGGTSAALSTTVYTSTFPVNINGPNLSTQMQGYITNFRLIRGQALYTTTFTPPTGPLQPIQGVTQAGTPYGTVLLLRNAPAPGRIQTSKFSGQNSAAVLPFPPAAMTTYATALNAGYGQGTYVASASSETAGNIAWQAFAKSGVLPTIWSSTGAYTAATGLYAGSNVTVDVTGTSYPGEWLQIQMPSSIVLSNYVIATRTDTTTQTPNKFWILGSRDGVNWNLVDSRTGATWASNGQLLTFTVTSGQAFTYFRAVINIINSGGVQTVATMAQFILNGSIEGLCVNPDGKVGVGLANPVQNLEVAGSALITGRVGIGSTMPATGTGIYLWSNTSGTYSQIFTQGGVYPSNGASVNRDALSILNNNGGSVNARINLWGDVFNVGPQIDYGAALHRFMHQNLSTFIGGFSNGNLLTGGATTISVDANGYIIRGATSDRRLKSNIVPMSEYGLATVSNLNPVSFEWNDDAKVKFGDGVQYGLIAQDVQKAFPWAVSESQDEQKTLTIDYPKFTIVLINAIKELEARVSALESPSS